MARNNSAPLSREAMAYVLAGGRGSRLMELTDRRAKPAVPFGGKSRIIDFALSNSINSGLRRIFIATQYKSLSLNRHIRMGWSIVSEELGEFIEILPPQKRVGEQWYQGTADAVLRNLVHFRTAPHDLVLILSGDHLYRMDYMAFIGRHRETNADITYNLVVTLLTDDPRVLIVDPATQESPPQRAYPVAPGTRLTRTTVALVQKRKGLVEEVARDFGTSNMYIHARAQNDREEIVADGAGIEVQMQGLARRSSSKILAVQ